MFLRSDMRRLPIACALAAVVTALTPGCSTGNTGGFGSDGGAQGGFSANPPLPIGCVTQSDPGAQSCAATETLVTCKSGARLYGCAPSPLGYCCPTARSPAPKPSAQVVTFCEAFAACSKGPSSPLGCEDKLATKEQFVGCAATYDALYACLLQPGVDPCELVTATPPCLDELTAYFECHIKPENPSCTPTAAASALCNDRAGSAGVADIGYACPKQPNVANECAIVSASVNGGPVEYAACCAPNALFQ
jgi:hypothetical protein